MTRTSSTPICVINASMLEKKLTYQIDEANYDLSAETIFKYISAQKKYYVT